MGTQVLPAANSLLHLRAHSADEDQSMVSAVYRRLSAEALKRQHVTDQH